MDFILGSNALILFIFWKTNYIYNLVLTNCKW